MSMYRLLRWRISHSITKASQAKRPPQKPQTLVPAINGTRKILSMITLRRIQDQIAQYIGQWQCAYKQGLSCIHHRLGPAHASVCSGKETLVCPLNRHWYVLRLWHHTKVNHPLSTPRLLGVLKTTYDLFVTYCPTPSSKWRSTTLCPRRLKVPSEHTKETVSQEVYLLLLLQAHSSTSL